MKINFKNAKKIIATSIMFAIIYTVILRVKFDMDIFVFLRLAATLSLIFFGVTMLLDIVIQLVKGRTRKK
jgi:hypothetical protein